MNIKFYAPNYLTYCRARDFFKNKVGRGRDIVEWLANFENDKVFFDIGSNIGIYSLYVCSLRKNISVYSFEPSANNLRVLSRNIFINNFHDSIKIIPIPLSNKSYQFNKMHDHVFEEGGALNSYGVDFDFEGKKIKLSQGSSYYVPSFSLDFLLSLEIIEYPDYIKIDVDGIEHLILEGSLFLEKNRKTKEILIEINDNFIDQKNKIFYYMNKYNFYLKKIFKNNIPSKSFYNTHDYLFIRNKI